MNKAKDTQIFNLKLKNIDRTLLENVADYQDAISPLAEITKNLNSRYIIEGNARNLLLIHSSITHVHQRIRTEAMIDKNNFS